jgi:hypothetical protein
MVRRLFPEARSERGQRNHCYFVEAVHALRSAENPDEFAWLFNTDTARRVILYVLGRQHWDVARAIFRERMRTREALEFIERVKAVAAQDNDASQVDDGDRP